MFLLRLTLVALVALVVNGSPLEGNQAEDNQGKLGLMIEHFPQD